MKRILALLAAVLAAPSLARAEGAADALGTFEERRQAILAAALAQPAKLTGGSPMHFWIAQQLFERGEKEQALAIVRAGLKSARSFIEKRERENHNNIGYNGFIHRAALNCYVRWHEQFDQALLDDYRYVFTPAEQLVAFRAAVRRASRIALTEAPAVTGVYTDRDGVVIARTFNGDTKIDGERVAYETWPLLENPWMRQEWEGPLTLTDGRTTRLYDVTHWTITERVTE